MALLLATQLAREKKVCYDAAPGWHTQSRQLPRLVSEVVFFSCTSKNTVLKGVEEPQGR